MYEVLSRFSQKEPKNVNGLARLAAVCFHLENDAPAADAAERCLELDPNNPVAKSIQGRLKARRTAVDLPPDVLTNVGGLTLDLGTAPLTW